jgi:hypothetical protein
MPDVSLVFTQKMPARWKVIVHDIEDLVVD